MTTQKIIKVNGQEWLIIKPEDIYAEMAKCSDQGFHVSDWAWQHAKYIGKRLSDNHEYWLPWNYKQEITELDSLNY